MSSLSVCPKCGAVVSYNSHFKAYLCKCGWEKIVEEPDAADDQPENEPFELVGSSGSCGQKKSISFDEFNR